MVHFPEKLSGHFLGLKKIRRATEDVLRIAYRVLREIRNTQYEICSEISVLIPEH